MVNKGTEEVDPHTGMTGEDPAKFAGIPDSYQRLWVPHRMVYVAGNAKPAQPDEGDSPTAKARCPFCIAPTKQDTETMVVSRGDAAFVVLNLFPYNAGHLLICPYRHVPDYTDLTDEETEEIARLSQQAMRVTRAVSKPAGFNIGMNQGVAGGAGIAAHLHQHVVPRWTGDANFLPVVGQTKALPELLADTRNKLAAAWEDAC